MKSFFFARFPLRRTTLFVGGALVLAIVGLCAWMIHKRERGRTILAAAGLRFSLAHGLERQFGVLEKPTELRFDMTVTNASTSPIDLSALTISPPCVHARLEPSQDVLLPGENAIVLLLLGTGERPGRRTVVMNVVLRKASAILDPAPPEEAPLFSITATYELLLARRADWSLPSLSFGRISANSSRVQRHVRLVVQNWSESAETAGEGIRVSSENTKLTVVASAPRRFQNRFENQAAEFLVSCTLDPADMANGSYETAIKAEWDDGRTGLWVTWEVTDDIQVFPDSAVTLFQNGDSTPDALVQFTSGNGQSFQVQGAECDIDGANIAIESTPIHAAQHTVHIRLHETRAGARSSQTGKLRFVIVWCDGRTEFKDLPCVIKRFAAPGDSE
jgi:hypothetical protein